MVCASVTSANKELIFCSYFDDQDLQLTEDVSMKSKGTALVICKEWKGCKYIAEKYKDTKLLDKEIKFSLFSENNPHQQVPY